MLECLEGGIGVNRCKICIIEYNLHEMVCWIFMEFYFIGIYYEIINLSEINKN